MHKVSGGWHCLCKAAPPAGSPRFAPRFTTCSIRDIGSLVVPVWNMEAGVVGGESFSLDNIEDDYLTSYFHDGRVHGGTSSSRVVVHAPWVRESPALLCCWYRHELCIPELSSPQEARLHGCQPKSRADRPGTVWQARASASSNNVASSLSSTDGIVASEHPACFKPG